MQTWQRDLIVVLLILALLGLALWWLWATRHSETRAGFPVGAAFAALFAYVRLGPRRLGLPL